MKRFLLLVGMVLFAARLEAQTPVSVASEANATPAGSAADAESNTETFLGRIGARLSFFNGTTWDRVRGDTTNGLWVNIKNSVAIGISGTPTVQPGNTANTTPWLFTPYQGGANLFTNAAALADATSNPTVTASGSYLFQYNGTTWDRVRGDTTNGLWVNVKSGTVTANQGGNWTTRIVGNTGAVLDAAGQNAAAPANWVQIGGQFNTSPTTLSSGNGSPLQLDNAGSLLVDVKGGALAAVGTLSNNGAAATNNRVAVLQGIAQTSYANGTAYTQGRDASPDVFTDGALHVAALPAMRPASYTAAADFAGSSTTDNAVMPGNATNTVLVTEVQITCTQTTAGVVHFSILKRSTADSAGTSAAMTVVPDDSNYAAGSSAPLTYTSTGPTTGTLVGSIDEVRIGCNASATAGPNDIYIGNFKLKPIVLRGTAQQLVINSNGAITGGNLSIHFKWIETTTITP